MEHTYPDVQFIVNAFARSLVVLTEEGELLLEDDNFELLNTGKWVMVSPVHSVMAKIHQVKAHIFLPAQHCVWEGARCGTLQEMLKTANRKRREIKRHQGKISSMN